MLVEKILIHDNKFFYINLIEPKGEHFKMNNSY